MADHYDALETRDPDEREAGLFRRLPEVLAAAMLQAGYANHLVGVDPAHIDSRAMLARLPLLRKSELARLHKASPPFGGFVKAPVGSFGRLFTSSGPIFEPEARVDDAWCGARALFAAGLRAGDVLLNTFSYHLTPEGFTFDSAAQALGCAVIPAGPGNIEQQMDLIEAFRPAGYAGTADFLKNLLDAAESAGRDISSLKLGCIGSQIHPSSLKGELEARDIDVFESYATPQAGIVAYETAARAGLVVNENLIVEIVQVGTNRPVVDGEIGELVLTSLDPRHPRIRLASGDLSAVVPGRSPCGRTNMRITGRLGSAEQTTRVNGLFVTPEQIAGVARRHPGLQRLRLVVTRNGQTDVMTLKAESAVSDESLQHAVAATLASITKLAGTVELVRPGLLPADGVVIADERRRTEPQLD